MKPIDNININVNLNVQPMDVPNVAGPAGQAAALGRIPENVLHGLEKAMQMFGAPRAAGQFNKLQDAEELVKHAFSRIQGPHVSPANRLLAQTEMERASQIRQSVARQIGGSQGMELLSADAFQQFGFELASNSHSFVGSW